MFVILTVLLALILLITVLLVSQEWPYGRTHAINLALQELLIAMDSVWHVTILARLVPDLLKQTALLVKQLLHCCISLKDCVYLLAIPPMDIIFKVIIIYI
jgi:hypothetical protein